jgi:hypothetical protein
VAPKEACVAWAKVLRAVAAGELSPGEALVRRPQVDDGQSDKVPSAFWSARDLLEQEVEWEMPEIPETRAYFCQVMTKLADRIEKHALVRH